MILRKISQGQVFELGFSILTQVKLQDIRLLSRSMLDLTLSAEVNYRASGSAKFAVLENKMSLDVSLTRRTRTRMLARDQQRL